MALELSTKLNWLNVRIIYLSGIKLLVLKEFLTEKVIFNLNTNSLKLYFYDVEDLAGNCKSSI